MERVTIALVIGHLVTLQLYLSFQPHTPVNNIVHNSRMVRSSCTLLATFHLSLNSPSLYITQVGSGAAAAASGQCFCLCPPSSTAFPSSLLPSSFLFPSLAIRLPASFRFHSGGMRQQQSGLRIQQQRQQTGGGRRGRDRDHGGIHL